MLEIIISEELIKALALFFVFLVVTLVALRYSNTQLVTKISELKHNYSEELSKIQKDLRQLVLVSARDKKELMDEIEALKQKLNEPKQQEHAKEKHSKKLKIVA